MVRETHRPAHQQGLSVKRTQAPLLARGYCQSTGSVHYDLTRRLPGDRPGLTDLINDARRELILMTYSAWPYQPLTEALTAAAGRGAEVVAVVETLA